MLKSVFRQAGTMSTENHSILIVDDDTDLRSLLTLIFSAAGYDVRVAADVPEAMQMCGAKSFDVVLTDVRMPGLTGHDLARWLANHHPATRSILMTGWDIGCDDCPILGSCTVLAKPFNPKDAVSLVGAVLARHTKKPET
jgi:DNA-binding NtrC family response regulator